MTLEEGIRKTYKWIMGEIAKDFSETDSQVELYDDACSTQVVV